MIRIHVIEFLLRYIVVNILPIKPNKLLFKIQRKHMISEYVVVLTWFLGSLSLINLGMQHACYFQCFPILSSLYNLLSWHRLTVELRESGYSDRLDGWRISVKSLLRAGPFLLHICRSPAPYLMRSGVY